MQRLTAPGFLLLTVTALIGLAATPAHASSIIVNGGFEAGFTGWTRVDALGSEGTFLLQSGTASPTNLLPVPSPPEGVTAAMSDAMGPGSHVLYQDFVVPTAVTTASLSFSLFVQNLAEDFFTPTTLDWSTPTLNQRARVDIMLASEDPLSLNVLLDAFETASGSPLVFGYSPYTVDITALLGAHAGQTLRLRFVDVNNVFLQNVGVDAVDIDVNGSRVPEPASLLLFATATAAAVVRRRRVCRPGL